MYFQVETWVFKNMACNEVWRERVGDATDNCFKGPSGNEERSLLSHLGCADADLLTQCMLLFCRSKSNKSAEYCIEMN